MVLQRDTTNPVWGSAQPGEAVTVAFVDQSKSSFADSSGHWRVDLDPEPAGGPYTLTVKGTSSMLVVNGVLVGEVWICAGQSNMRRHPVSPSVMETYPLIHLQRHDWGDIAPHVPWVFGTTLFDTLQVPVGLINRAVPGSTIFRWMRTGTLYKQRIKPIQPYKVRGVIWWQGESDTIRPEQYALFFPILIQQWRQDWQQGDFPFLFVQLPTGGGFTALEGGPTPLPALPPRTVNADLMREAYQVTLDELPDTGMVTNIDLQGGLHPPGDPYGARLGTLALGLVYGQIPFGFSGPIYDSLTITGNQARIAYRGGTAVGLHPKGLTTVQGFSIAGADRRFYWADATVDGEEIVVSSSAVQEPVAVRYAWYTDPRWANLFNDADMGAAPFRTDSW